MPHVEERKIIKVGKTSFAVILPMPWLRFFKLDDTNRVRVTSNDVIKIEPIGKGS